ncbi:MAG: fatty acid oxidation complex subunit alpha FadJ [Acidimicrobiia bacterium]
MTDRTTDLQLTHFRLSVDRVGVAMVLIDRAGEKMNTISPDLFEDLARIAAELRSDAAVRAVVLGSAKPDNFLAGADLRWLRNLEDGPATVAMFNLARAALQDLEDLWRVHGKPVVAAIHGPCLGGGLEVALTASMRVCSSDSATQFGQPEVKLGLIPGGGGTQRLPRLVGIATGLDLILTGRTIRPRRAHRIGLVDEVCPQEVLLAVARERAAGAVGRTEAVRKRDGTAMARARSWLSPTHLQQVALEQTPIGRKVLFAKAAERMLAETKGNYPAPPAALRAVKVGIEEGLDAGYAAEIDEFAPLPATPEAQALISIFFASQAAKRDRGIDSDTAPSPLGKVGVLGGGLMGGGIAAVNATRAGVRTRIREIDDAGIGRGLGYVSRTVAGLERRKRLTRSEAARAMHLVTGTTDWTGFGNADLVIEAVFEDLELKQTMLREVEAVGRVDTIFASNTSSIPIARIAEAAARPENVIGMHYFSPVEKMPLLEVIVTDQTADRVTATCVAFGKRQGKTVIVVNDGPGFYTTRVLAPYAAEVGHLLEEGVPIESIDAAMEQWGFPVGPVVLSDEVGIDTGAKIAVIMQDAFGARMQPPPIFQRLAADDRKGRKNGRGFYTYDGGTRGGVDETVYAALDVTPGNDMKMSVIQDRLSLLLVNEAARCLEERVLRSARDGDIGAVFGLGFPPFRGGPFHWVDHVGAASVAAKLDRLAAEHGPRYEPAAILRAHADSGAPLRYEAPG